MAIPLTGTIGTTAPTDTFGTHDSNLGIGGVHTVADKAARNAITPERRRKLMIVGTQDTGQYWSLTADTFTGTDADWTLFGSGNSIAVPVEVETFDFPTPLSEWVINHTLGGKPTVTMTDLDGVEFYGVPEYVSDTEIRIEFLIPGGMAGQATVKSKG